MNLNKLKSELARIDEEREKLSLEIRRIEDNHILKAVKNHKKPLFQLTQAPLGFDYCPKCGRSFKPGSYTDMRVNGAVKA